LTVESVRLPSNPPPHTYGSSIENPRLRALSVPNVTELLELLFTVVIVPVPPLPRPIVITPPPPDGAGATEIDELELDDTARVEADTELELRAEVDDEAVGVELNEVLDIGRADEDKTEETTELNEEDFELEDIADDEAGRAELELTEINEDELNTGATLEIADEDNATALELVTGDEATETELLETGSELTEEDSRLDIVVIVWTLIRFAIENGGQVPSALGATLTILKLYPNKVK
jgi:hypothetical protein